MISVYVSPQTTRVIVEVAVYVFAIVTPVVDCVDHAVAVTQSTPLPYVTPPIRSIAHDPGLVPAHPAPGGSVL